MESGPFRLVDRAAHEAAEEDLAPSATRSAATRGRAVAEPEDLLRTAFERDRDRILHAKAFRRLKHKTQVFLNPDGDHFVTRLTHTLQVTQVARSLIPGSSRARGPCGWPWGCRGSPSSSRSHRARTASAASR